MSTPTYAQELIRTVLQKDPGVASPIGCVIASPCYQAVMLQRAARWCRLQGWDAAGVWTTQFGRMLTGIDIDPTAVIGRRVFFEARGQGAVIGAGVRIGDDCLIGPFVSILPKDGASPVIGCGVVLGAGARIAGGVTIGDYAVVAPNAVVETDVPAGAPPEDDKRPGLVIETEPVVDEKNDQKCVEQHEETLDDKLDGKDALNTPNTAEIERLAKEAEKRVADFDAQVAQGQSAAADSTKAP